ncbi:hypothetical protein [Sulfuriferula sp.]|nr:hypothetical protein [Sulfuriferula sp.]MDP2026430.1 hypothetical protein [Sulfuriferula sp.]
MSADQQKLMRQAWALSYAIPRRVDQRACAKRYFEVLRKLLSTKVERDEI